MKIYLNEQEATVPTGARVDELVKQRKPGADICILNGFPCLLEHNLAEGDRLVLIKRGEVPSAGDLEQLLVARHTPGIHQRLKVAIVGIAGCGGLGSNAAMALARVGVGKLVIADFDVVEPSNLNRQQFFVDQIGQPKVVALEQNIKRANPYIQIVPHHLRIVPENVATLFGEAGVIVEAFDRADQKRMLLEAVLDKLPGKPIVIGNGMAGYGANGMLRTRSIGNVHVCGDEATEAGPGIGLMAPRVGIAAHMQANMVLEILLGPDPRIKAPNQEGRKS